jgi:hypothetical protein
VELLVLVEVLVSPLPLELPPLEHAYEVRSAQESAALENLAFFSRVFSGLSSDRLAAPASYQVGQAEMAVIKGFVRALQMNLAGDRSVLFFRKPQGGSR